MVLPTGYHWALLDILTTKPHEMAVKYKLANQEVDGFPLTIVGCNTADINTALKKDETLPIRILTID